MCGRSQWRTESLSTNTDMPRDIYGVAHNLPYNTDGDSAFRELVKMLSNDEMFEGEDKRITRDETIMGSLVVAAPPDDYLHVQHIKDGIIGVSIVAIVLMFLIIILARRSGSGGGANQSIRSQSDQTPDTIIDLEGNTQVHNQDVRSCSNYV